jgi:hypothetical protein
VKKIKRCYNCPTPELTPYLYTRWQNDREKYHFVQCGSYPACETGECTKLPDDAIDAWNNEFAKPKKETNP